MNKPNKQQGQVIIINTLLFFAVSIAIVFAVTSPVITSFQVTKSFIKSKEAFLLGNSASAEAVYKLNEGMTLSSSETITLSQGSAVISVADTGDGKTVSISSDSDSYKRNYQVKLSQSSGVNFNYGLQSGQGGFEMAGGAGIIGNVYANGDVMGTGGPFITGSAVSANISDPVVVTTNNTGSISPTHEIRFGEDHWQNPLPEDVAQSFTVSTSTPISSVRILIKKSGTGWMNNVTLRITDNASGKPGGTSLAQGTISASTVTTSYGYLNVPFTSTVSLVPGTRYWLVFDTAKVYGQHYALGANSGVFGGGEAKTAAAGWSSSGGGTWINTSPATMDAYFDVYAGGSTGLIQGISISGDAWAHEVNNSTVNGVIYCQGGVSNNKTCDTSRPSPAQQSLPLSDGNIADWIAEATAGGATSTISLGSNTVRTIGPVVVNGNLSVGSGATLNLNGPVYVTGNLTVDGGGKIRINPSLGAQSLVIVSEGRVVAGGGGQFQGSGVTGSYILVVTNSTCPTGPGCSGSPAIDVSGGTGAVVLNAQKGTIRFTGGAQAKQATAHKIVMDGGTRVTYESGLANMNFSSGPSGAWTIDSWKEVE